MKNNIVYVLTNDSIPDMVKIGFTDTTVEQRMRDLFQTGVPTPFKCYCAYSFEEGKLIERKLHEWLRGCRVYAKREFFEIDPEAVRTMLMGLNGKEIEIKLKNKMIDDEGNEVEENDVKIKQTYTYEDFLDKTENKTLLENIRNFILNIGEDLKEIFNKDYINYKVQSSFFSIEPFKQHFKCWIWIDDINHLPKFSRIVDGTDKDGKEIHIGHHGNGNVEFKITNIQEFDSIKQYINKSYQESKY